MYVNQFIYQKNCNEVKSETSAKSDMVEVSHISVASPDQCALYVHHWRKEQLWGMGGGGKRLKQVYFIGGSSAMDLVHSAAW